MQKSDLIYVGVKLDVPKENAFVKTIIYFVQRCASVYIAQMIKVTNSYRNDVRN